MKLNEFNDWVNDIEANTRSIPDSEVEKIENEVFEFIHFNDQNNRKLQSVNSNGPEPLYIDVEKTLESMYPNNKKSKKHRNRNLYLVKKSFKPVKVAIITVVCLVGLSISGITYAAITGRLSGVYRATPELEKQLDYKRETQMPETLPGNPDYTKHPSKYDNTTILNETSFDDPSFYNVITDVVLIPDPSNHYSTDPFIFDITDIAVFTRQNKEGWNLKKGDQISISIAIDTSFADCEPAGEQISIAYIKDGKYNDIKTEVLSDTPYCYSFTAPEDGCYYFALYNVSLSYIKVTTLEIY